MFRFLLACALVAGSLAADNFDKERQGILDIFAGEWLSECIFAATKLELADALQDGPQSTATLAKAKGLNEDSLYRLMRTLASRGLFHEEEGRVFSHTPSSLLLAKNHPDSLHALILFYSTIVQPSWEGLVSSVKSGEPGFNAVFRDNIFSHFQKNPGARILFSKAMEEKSKAVTKSSILAYDFGRFKSVYDIGGGNGHFLWSILEAHPEMKGKLFDLPEITRGVKAPNADFKARAEIVSGDFFKDIPQGGNVYLLKSILHDWNDENAEKILTCCRMAMNQESRLLIIEPVMLGSNQKDYAKLMDILMMNVTGGKERSLEDFRNLLTASGFQLMNVYPTSTEFRLLEAKILN